MVGRLDFHVCAEKTSNRQYFFWDMPRLQVFLYNKGPHNQSRKFCDNSVKPNLLGFFLKSLKIAPLKMPYGSPTSMVCASNLSEAWARCNLQTHQRKTCAKCGVVSVHFVTGYSLFVYVFSDFSSVRFQVLRLFFFLRATFWIDCFCWISELIPFYYSVNIIVDINKIAIVIVFRNIPIYLKYSKKPLVFQSATALKFPVLIIKMYSLSPQFMSSHIFLVLFGYYIFSSFRLKNSHHIHIHITFKFTFTSFFSHTTFVFTTFLFLTFVYEPDRSSHREVFLIITVPVRGGHKKTYKDVIL